MAEELIAYLREAEKRLTDDDSFLELSVVAGERGDVAMLERLRKAGFLQGEVTLSACVESGSVAAMLWATENVEDAWLHLFRRVLHHFTRNPFKFLVEHWCGQDAERIVRTAVVYGTDVDILELLHARGALEAHRDIVEGSAWARPRPWPNGAKWLRAHGFALQPRERKKNVR